MRYHEAMTRLVLVAGFCGVAFAGVHAGGQDLTRTEAASMEKKLAAILERGNRTPLPKAQPLRTAITEREVNAYLQHSVHAQMPVGLTKPRIAISDGGKVEGKALIDIDAIKNSRPRGVLDPIAYLTGTVEVALVGTLYAANGKGVFQLQNASLGGLSIPKSLLNDLVAHYTRTPDHPKGVDLDSPFDLPARIRQVEIQRGAATIIQ
jgi:hypothetical protein